MKPEESTKLHEESRCDWIGPLYFVHTTGCHLGLHTGKGDNVRNLCSLRLGNWLI